MAVPASEIVYWTGMAAVAVNAVTGVLETEGKRMDLVGATIVGLVAALGGGTLRDLLLDRHVFWIGDQAYLFCGMGAVLVTFLAARLVHVPANLFLLPDALGLALFTVVGTKIALGLDTPWLAASFMGVITGVFGGVLRDILANEVPLVMRPGTLYATASWAGALLLILLLELEVGEGTATAAAGVTVFVMRVAAIRYRLTLPIFSSKK
ncbi:MAG: trimeric intracellular cation channel family protein [Pseudomonadota bacterium]